MDRDEQSEVHVNMVFCCLHLRQGHCCADEVYHTPPLQDVGADSDFLYVILIWQTQQVCHQESQTDGELRRTGKSPANYRG